MSEEKKIPESEEAPTGQISRREFLRDAGLVVGSATIGSIALLNSCKGGEAETVTTTLPGPTVAGKTVTVTSTAPATTVQAVTQKIKLNINGKIRELAIGYDVQPWDTLVYTLRDKLALTGTKLSCNEGVCGACMVLMDGKAILACMMLTVWCEGKAITTIEGLADPATGKLHPVQQAFIDNHGFQCGFCAPGMIISAKALLDKNPNPTVDQIRQGLAGNLCRCGNYTYITEAVLAAAKTIGGK
jgi:aerobic carbon-monoxide dehydrogenase small subunit